MNAPTNIMLIWLDKLKKPFFLTLASWQEWYTSTILWTVVISENPRWRHHPWYGVKNASGIVLHSEKYAHTFFAKFVDLLFFVSIHLKLREYYSVATYFFTMQGGTILYKCVQRKTHRWVADCELLDSNFMLSSCLL